LAEASARAARSLARLLKKAFSATATIAASRIPDSSRG
jgi:hypothetical protein